MLSAEQFAAQFAALRSASEDQANARQRVEAKPVDADSVLTTLQNAAAALGNGTAINLKGYRGLTLEVTGTFVATVTFEATIDDTSWFALGLGAAGTGTIASTATAAGAFSLPAGWPAVSQVRAQVSAYTSGNVTVKARQQPR